MEKDKLEELTKALIEGNKQIEDFNDFARIAPIHYNLSFDQWICAKFKADEVSFRPKYIIDDFEKWQEEFKTNPYTTIVPDQIYVSPNVLALTGLTESAKRDTGETSTTVRHVGLGTGSTAELESQTALVTEITGGGYVRKDLTVEGQRKVLNQTSKFGVAWDDGDVGATIPIILKEGGLFSLSAAGVMHARVRFTDFTLNTGDLFVIQINEQHANGTL